MAGHLSTSDKLLMRMLKWKTLEIPRIHQIASGHDSSASSQITALALISRLKFQVSSALLFVCPSVLWNLWKELSHISSLLSISLTTTMNVFGILHCAEAKRHFCSSDQRIAAPFHGNHLVFMKGSCDIASWIHAQLAHNSTPTKEIFSKELADF